MASAYDNVVIEKLKLKGKALDIKAVRIKKKMKRHHKSYQYFPQTTTSGGRCIIFRSMNEGGEGKGASYDDYLTPFERRFLQQREKVEVERLAKMARMSHRDRIQEFNQYLANLSDHYDIPKVGPG
ncbi:hypothetical protein TanjilG_13985 [Lupinus angustifolius]|uniref:Protein FAM32A-like n=1 Tax=Lupinus angustifolius TaxID=3871 RepID=A0A1J7I8Z0_LUPAN|nr:hypothetical protein TanjilG_13985 [Lupinus angustifolius]